MAIYYLDLSKGTKGKKDKKGKGIYRGKSALAKYNYIIRDENYIKGKEEILATEYGYLPNFAKDNPAFFWEATDKFEAKNGVVFRQLIFALPRELNAEQQQELCRNFAEVVCGKYKLPYIYAIHKGEFDHRGNRNTEETNPHCHLIFSERANDETEQKKRTAENYFQRNGGAKKIRELQAKNWLLEHRKLWADLANQALEKAGYSERIDHRSLLEQGITDRNPQKKRYWRDDQNIAPYYLTDLEKELKQQLSKNKKLQKEIKASIEQEAREKAKAEDKELADMFDGFYKALDNKTEFDNPMYDREAEKALKEAEEEKAKNDVLTKRLTLFAKEYEDIQQKELTEQDKVFYKNLFNQEYNRGGVVALDKYILSCLTKLEADRIRNERKEKSEEAPVKAQTEDNHWLKAKTAEILAEILRKPPKSNPTYQTTPAPQAQPQQQPQQQPQNPELLPNFSAYENNPALVGQRVFALLGGNEETGQMPNLRKLPQAIEELKKQGFSINESKLNKAIKQARAGEIDAIDLSNVFAESISPQSRDYVKTKDYIR